MPANLDISPLRSLVAIADLGGFQRAARALHLSQGAVSQHVRRLEAAIGRPLVERDGRGSRFTEDGQVLLVHARRILTAHDGALDNLRVATEPPITVGCTEHAATRLLPLLTAELATAAPDRQFKFRIDRGSRLREAMADGSVDIALLFAAGNEDAIAAGRLELSWFGSPMWTAPPPPEPVPVVAFDEPCALRTRALHTLAGHRLPAVIGAEATHLAGVHAAVAAGLGTALLATLGEVPAGLRRVDVLPRPEPLELFVCPRPGLATGLGRLTATAVSSALNRALDADVAKTPASAAS